MGIYPRRLVLNTTSRTPNPPKRPVMLLVFYICSNLARSKIGRFSSRSLSLTAAKRLARGSPDLREVAVVEVEADDDNDEVANEEADVAPPFA